MLFDGPPSELPIATLRRSVHGRRRTILVGLERWLSQRLAWLRPRTVPLLVAFASLFVTLGAVKAMAICAPGEPLALTVHARVLDAPPRPDRTHGNCRIIDGRPAARKPIRILLQPLAPGGPYTELTIGTLDTR